MTWWVPILCALIGAAPPSVLIWLTRRDLKGIKSWLPETDKKISGLIALISKKRNKTKTKL